MHHCIPDYEASKYWNIFNSKDKLEKYLNIAYKPKSIIDLQKEKEHLKYIQKLNIFIVMLQWNKAQSVNHICTSSIKMCCWAELTHLVK